MAELINLATNLDVLDPPVLEQTKWGPDANRWLSNIVDIINASLSTINGNFNIINQSFANLLAVGQIDVGGGGVGPINVPVTDLLSTNVVSVKLISSSNDVTISTVLVENGDFKITFSADPGASAIIVYQAYTAQPQ